MQDAFSRMELLVGNTGVKKLSMAKIAVFGLGGAGAQAAEALARCGVGKPRIHRAARQHQKGAGSERGKDRTIAMLCDHAHTVVAWATNAQGSTTHGP